MSSQSTPSTTAERITLENGPTELDSNSSTLSGHSFRKSCFRSSFQSLIGSAVLDFASRFVRLSGSLTTTIAAACAEQQYFSMQRGPGRAVQQRTP